MHDITTQEETQVLVRGTDYYICEDYDWDYGYNVAIIKLSQPLEQNQYISPIPLNLNHGLLNGRLV